MILEYEGFVRFRDLKKIARYNDEFISKIKAHIGDNNPAPALPIGLADIFDCLIASGESELGAFNIVIDIISTFLGESRLARHYRAAIAKIVLDLEFFDQFFTKEIMPIVDLISHLKNDALTAESLEDARLLAESAIKKLNAQIAETSFAAWSKTPPVATLSGGYLPRERPREILGLMALANIGLILTQEYLSDADYTAHIAGLALKIRDGWRWNILREMLRREVGR